MMRQHLIYAIIFCILATTCVAQQTAKLTPNGIGFLEYLPDGYSSNTNKYPIVISLHGIKEKGNTLTSVKNVANVGLPKYVKSGQKYPFILISPQLKTTMGRWTGDYVMSVLNHVKTYLRIDPNRIYLTGLSLGGGGLWSVATSYPDVWAALLPLCSGYNITALANKIAERDIPTWGFHGDADATVSESVTINMINAINRCKPSPLAKLTIFPGMGHIIWDKVYKETSALSWLLSFKKETTSSTTSINKSPIAQAGIDKSIALPSNGVTINGNGSDPDGSISSYSWKKKSGGSVTLTGATSKTLKISNLVAGTYVFTLTVKDNDGATDTDDVTVIVKNGTTTNVAPIASAGSDKLVVLPSSSLALPAHATDKDGTIKSYSWTKLSGPAVHMYNQTSATLKLSSLIPGKYIFRLTVKDDKGASDADDVIVNVTSAPKINAGADKTITLPYGSLTLSATGSDSDGTIVSWRWSKYSGPSILSMKNSATSKVTLTNMYPGTYVLKLAVKDNDGATSYDYVKLIVHGSGVSVNWINEHEKVLAML